MFQEILEECILDETLTAKPQHTLHVNWGC